ncbi:Homoserine dehydrogenase [Brettanomyces nanus]|uniref:Homoserine dehydrogenase n=1 Tax=Eeniella nana TaxID=13502 RepID=A0A875RVP3_EENNA|nr:Homoserine dehydrogenase [Brettanomyces nanus]QPG73061.1 Homoserine dehydrogenase [Brettanomyces nanus]
MAGVNIAIIGAGVVGSELISQLTSLKGYIEYNVVILAESKHVLRSEDYSPLNMSSWKQNLAASSKPPMSPAQIADFMKKSPLPAILVDNTSNQTIANSYPIFIKAGISVATPNKKAFSSDIKLWNSIFDYAGKPGYGLCYHESSVGAGLPLISPLKEMILTGDEVLKIEGIFSGTLSYIFNEFSAVKPSNTKFSDVVKIAKQKGYTEPDPRDDLNGLDVARKVTILARISGLPVESATSFPVQSLIPKELESVSSGDEFLQRLPEFDDQMESLKAEAAKEGKVLRFIGTVDVPSKKTSVKILKYDFSHPFASLKGSDNVISIKTKRYPNPLIIQGAGAGAAVTAMGVLGDVIKIAQRIAH